VLYAAAAQAGLISAEVNANMTAIVVLSMALTPLVVLVARRFMTAPSPSTEGLETPYDRSSCVLLIGFGRFGQVVSQLLLARDMDITIIDTDPERIRNARDFGFQVYYGDGSRLDVLHASGAHKACIIAVCVDDKKTASRILELLKSEFPQAKVFIRAYDRVHARELVLGGADYQIRETFESALTFAQQTLRAAEVPEDEVLAVADDIRRRDRERFELEVANGSSTAASRGLLIGNLPKPAPLVPPKRETKSLNPGGDGA
jgi:glutathione-regulated potassium-efflux system protein KefB